MMMLRRMMMRSRRRMLHHIIIIIIIIIAAHCKWIPKCRCLRPSFWVVYEETWWTEKEDQSGTNAIRCNQSKIKPQLSLQYSSSSSTQQLVSGTPRYQVVVLIFGFTGVIMTSVDLGGFFPQERPLQPMQQVSAPFPCWILMMEGPMNQASGLIGQARRVTVPLD